MMMKNFQRLLWWLASWWLARRLKRLEQQHARRSAINSAAQARSAEAPSSALYRQGDILLRRTTERPGPMARLIGSGSRVILAYGEATGHAHEVVALNAVENGDTEKPPAAELFEDSVTTKRLLIINEEVKLQHPQHTAHVYAPGVYEVTRQRQLSDADEQRWIWTQD